MTFTNDDLKKLKESMEHYPAWYQERCGDIVPRLLARLEASEEALNIAWNYVCRNRGGVSEKEVDRAVEAWRKACGK